MWKRKFQKRCCLPIKGKTKKKSRVWQNTGEADRPAKTGAQFPSCCEHDDKSYIEGKNELNILRIANVGLTNNKKTTVL